MLPVPTVAYLVAFTGRPEDSFTAYADQALIQATLLFSTVTKLSVYPDDEDQQNLAINAILEMADRIYLDHFHAVSNASPFSSETIGSYSYVRRAALAGERTGLFWWDLAIDELVGAERSLVMSGSVSALERDSMYLDSEGNRFVFGPAETSWLGDWPGGDNVELSPRPVLG